MNQICSKLSEPTEDSNNVSPVDVVRAAVAMLLSEQTYEHASRQLDDSISSTKTATTIDPATMHSSSSYATTMIFDVQRRVVTSLFPITHELTLLVAGTW